jgi:hypothetical protein
LNTSDEDFWKTTREREVERRSPIVPVIGVMADVAVA